MLDRLDFETYQQNANRTSANKAEIEAVRKHGTIYFGTMDWQHATAVAGLGLAGEAGECADLIKKVVGHGHNPDAAMREKIEKELGDILWYIADVAALFNISLERIAATNVYKLKQRYPNGFSTEASVNRKD